MCAYPDLLAYGLCLLIIPFGIWAGYRQDRKHEEAVKKYRHNPKP